VANERGCTGWIDRWCRIRMHAHKGGRSSGRRRLHRTTHTLHGYMRALSAGKQVRALIDWTDVSSWHCPL
jgi:hypothetical protein